MKAQSKYKIDAATGALNLPDY